MTNPVRCFFVHLSNWLAPRREILGKLTLAAGIGMVTLGFPSQIYANLQARECRIDPILATVVLALYIVRLPYQLSAKAWYLLPADVLGFMGSIILMAQYFIY